MRALARPAGGLVALAAVTAFCGFVAVPKMFGTLVAHDDEGYLLVSLRQFLGHGDLYDGTYSQYGPFYYVLFGGLFRLAGRSPTLYTGRLIQTTAWMGASVLSALAVLLLTRRWLAAAFAQLATFGALIALAAEPMHPGALICLLLAALVALLAVDAGRARAVRAAAVGGIVCALLLVKINVGALTVIALAVAMVVGSRAAPRWARAATAAVAVVVPWVLLSADLDSSWRQLAGMTSLAAAVLVVVLWFDERDQPQPLPWPWLAAGVGAVAAVTAVTMLATGTSIGGLVDGALLRPLRQRSGYNLPFEPTGYVPLLLVSSAVVPLYLWWRSRAGQRWVALAGGLVNGVAGAVLICSVLGWGIGGGPLGFVPLAALIALAPTRRSPTLGRRALVAVAIFQTLHAYPVAGSQLAFASFLLVPVGVVGIVDALEVVRAPLGLAGPVAAVCIPALLVAGFVTDDRFDPVRTHDAYEAEAPLRLPGAGLVHGLPLQVSQYRTITRALRRSCDSFYSMPGLGSFHVFTGIASPTGYNVGPWMFVLDEDEQRHVIRQLERVDHLCVLRNNDEFAFWQGDRSVPDGPLVRYLVHLSEPVAHAGGYFVWARARSG